MVNHHIIGQILRLGTKFLGDCWEGGWLLVAASVLCPTVPNRPKNRWCHVGSKYDPKYKQIWSPFHGIDIFLLVPHFLRIHHGFGRTTVEPTASVTAGYRSSLFFRLWDDTADEIIVLESFFPYRFIFEF